MNLKSFFNYKPMKEMADFMATFNCESQAVAIDGSNAENIQTTGGKLVFIAGSPVALPADAELDISADTVSGAVGNSIAQDKVQWYAVFAKADGTLRVEIASDEAAAGSETFKMPDFDPSTYVCIGLMKVAPTSGAHVLGTTALTTVGTFYQVTSPVFPHADYLDKN